MLRRLTLGCFHRNYHVTEHMGNEFVAFGLREGENIGCTVDISVLPVQVLNIRVIHQQDAQFIVLSPQSMHEFFSMIFQSLGIDLADFLVILELNIHTSLSGTRGKIID